MQWPREIFQSHNTEIVNIPIMNWYSVNPLRANPTKWLNTLKQFAGNLPTNCLSVFDHFVGLALKELNQESSQNEKPS